MQPVKATRFPRTEIPRGHIPRVSLNSTTSKLVQVCCLLKHHLTLTSNLSWAFLYHQLLQLPGTELYETLGRDSSAIAWFQHPGRKSGTKSCQNNAGGPVSLARPFLGCEGNRSGPCQTCFRVGSKTEFQHRETWRPPNQLLL